MRLSCFVVVFCFILSCCFGDVVCEDFDDGDECDKEKCCKAEYKTVGSIQRLDKCVNSGKCDYFADNLKWIVPVGGCVLGLLLLVCICCCCCRKKNDPAETLEDKKTAEAGAAIAVQEQQLAMLRSSSLSLFTPPPPTFTIIEIGSSQKSSQGGMTIEDDYSNGGNFDPFQNANTYLATDGTSITSGQNTLTRGSRPHPHSLYASSSVKQLQLVDGM